MAKNLTLKSSLVQPPFLLWSYQVNAQHPTSIPLLLFHFPVLVYSAVLMYHVQLSLAFGSVGGLFGVAVAPWGKGVGHGQSGWHTSARCCRTRTCKNTQTDESLCCSDGWWNLSSKHCVMHSLGWEGKATAVRIELRHRAFAH